jgi:RNA polymerase sigma-70 factor (ECF subfamily)
MVKTSANHEIDEMLPTRRSLLGRLKNLDDDASWHAFFDTYWRLIYNTALKCGLSDSEAQDAVQETVLCVAKSMGEFEYEEKGSFKAWLLRLTRWRIADQFRKRQRGIEAGRGRDATSTGTATLEQVPDPAGLVLEAAWNREWETNLLEAALERVKKMVDAKHYQVYDLCFSKGWAVARVARFLNINTGHVYLIKHRLTKMLKKEVERLREKPL